MQYDFQMGRTRNFSDKDVLTRTGLKLAFIITTSLSNRVRGIGAIGCQGNPGRRYTK
ncbi:hypothetical protein SFC43_27600 [Bacteroides sp. CR5/BHMF/2]|nr:hypothetical protein [Bacteroides sp. CR5/BHMF/2]